MFPLFALKGHNIIGIMTSLRSVMIPDGGSATPKQIPLRGVLFYS